MNAHVACTRPYLTQVIHRHMAVLSSRKLMNECQMLVLRHNEVIFVRTAQTTQRSSIYIHQQDISNPHLTARDGELLACVSNSCRASSPTANVPRCCSLLYSPDSSSSATNDAGFQAKRKQDAVGTTSSIVGGHRPCVMERMSEMWRPSRRWMLQHSSQTRTPRLMDAQPGSE